MDPTDPLTSFPASLQRDWEPLGLLGEGAMGRVFRCRHRREGFEAALKLTRLPGNPVLEARTLREARTLAQLRHPGLVRVYTGGRTEEGDVFLAMELLEGRELGEALPLADPLGVLLQVGEALEAVHGSGLVHRDVKPANIVLTGEGRAVLVDFGLVYDPARTRLTATGHLAGTPIYLAPEMFRGEPPSPATDWYAWGVTLFEALEGRRPFELQALGKLLEGEDLPPPEFRVLAPGAPEFRLLRVLLCGRTGERPTSLGEIRRVLAQEGPGVTRASPVPELPSPTPTGAAGGAVSRKAPLVLGALLAAGLGLGWLSGSGTGPSPGTAPPLTASPGTSLPEGAESAGPDPWRDTRVRSRHLEELVERLQQVHGESDRLFLISWHAGEVPSRFVAHSEDLEEGGARDWEELVGALRSWLVQLDDWQRDHPDAPPPERHPEVRALLDGRVVPLARHLVEDFLVSWIRVWKMGSIGLQTRDYENFLDSCAELGLFLDDRGELSPGLLSLRVMLPGSLSEPAALLAPFQERIESVLERSRDRLDLWNTSTALLHALAYEIWGRSVPWEERRRLLELLSRRVDDPGSPLGEEDRVRLGGRILVEGVRLARFLDRPPEPGDLAAWFLGRLARFRLRAAGHPAISRAALECVDDVLHSTRGLLYQVETPPADFRGEVVEALAQASRDLRPAASGPTGG